MALVLGISACSNAKQSETPILENNVSESRTEQTETSLSADTTETASTSFYTNGMAETVQSFVNDVSFNFETKTVTLNSGYEMPIYGIGTYSLLNEECVNSVSTALENGVRLIDTAYMYHNDVICCEV